MLQLLLCHPLYVYLLLLILATGSDNICNWIYYYIATDHVSGFFFLAIEVDLCLQLIILCIVFNLQEEKNRYPNCARCSPSLFHKFMEVGLTDDLRNRIKNMGFQGLLDLAADSLDSRDFLDWLMDIFNPETMMLEIGGGKQLPITEHAFSCVMGVPNSGIDPPDPDNDTPAARVALVERLFPNRQRDQPKDKEKYHKFSASQIGKVLKDYHEKEEGDLDEDLCLRLFFMVANNTILTPNTDSYIRLSDVKWCEDLDTIQNINWSKVGVDYLRFAGRKWKASKKDRPPLLGCSIFLIVSVFFFFFTSLLVLVISFVILVFTFTSSIFVLLLDILSGQSLCATSKKSRSPCDSSLRTLY